MSVIGNISKDGFLCPACSHDWSYGYVRTSEFVKRLMDKRKICCAKCGTLYEFYKNKLKKVS